VNIISTICPHCDAEYHAPTYFVAAPPDAVPHDGDAVLCVMCGEWCIYDDEESGGLRAPNKHEARSLNDDERSRYIRQAWHDFTATRN
jgi:hypothetical protein